MSRRRSNPAANLYDTRPALAWTSGADALYCVALSGDLFEAQLLSMYHNAVAALDRDMAMREQPNEQQREEPNEHRDTVLQVRAELRVLRAWPILCRDVDLVGVARRVADAADWSPDERLALETEVALHERAAEAARAADPVRFRHVQRVRRENERPKWACERCARTTRIRHTRGAAGRERVLCGWCAGRHDREQQLQEAMRDAHHCLFPEA